MSNVYVNVFRQSNHVLVAACDAELLGKTLKEGNVVFKIQEHFYGGSLVRIEEAVGILKRATCANLVGSKIVGVAVKEGLVHPQSVVLVSGVPHVQIIRM
jgi:hypothetical protein